VLKDVVFKKLEIGIYNPNAIEIPIVNPEPLNEETKTPIPINTIPATTCNPQTAKSVVQAITSLK
jgi:hypothetical protein